jgi:coenzyme F420-0:L-glutamate ligase/coenzyme F420-1:gamma-L-glutamate ligase
MLKRGDNLAKLIVDACRRMRFGLKDHDVIVVAHKAVSKTEGQVIKLRDIQPSELASDIAKKGHSTPEVVELALKEASSIVKNFKGRLITETKHGFIMPFSGVDQSNVDGGASAVLLPVDPDASAKDLREALLRLTGRKLAVIISDSTGRPFRRGTTDIAIGVSGITPIVDLRGRSDLFRRRLRVKQVALADELASAAELLMGQASEGIPAVVIRGVSYRDSDEDARALVRPRGRDLFA